MQVFGKDLTEAGQTSSGAEVFGQYSLHDLVILEGGVPGVIVKIEHQAALVLTSNGTQERPDVRTCRLPDIQRKIMGGSATAQDNVNNTIGKDMIVSVVEGVLRGKSGNVLWCHRGFVFVLCRRAAPARSLARLRRERRVVGAARVLRRRADAAGWLPPPLASTRAGTLWRTGACCACARARSRARGPRGDRRGPDLPALPLSTPFTFAPQRPPAVLRFL